MIIWLNCLFFILYIPNALAESDVATLQLKPSMLSVNIFYGGANVRVEGSAPADTDLVVVCSGEREALHMKKKEKVGGVLWMNRGEVTFENVPQFFAVNSSRKLRKLAPQQVLNRLGVIFGNFSVQAEAPITQGGKATLIEELTKLRRNERLFVSNENGVTIDRNGKDRELWSTVIALPSKLSPGDYHVNLFGFRDRTGTLLGSKTLKVRQVGMSALIYSLAKNHGLLYGLAAVIIALLVGLLTGMAFGLGSKGGH